MNEINIPQFEYEEFQELKPFNCMIIGSIMSGKSYFVLYKLWPQIEWRFPDLRKKKKKKQTPDSLKKKILSKIGYGEKDSEDESPLTKSTVYIVTAEHNKKQYEKVIPHALTLTDFSLFPLLIKKIQHDQKNNIIGQDENGEEIYAYEILIIIDDAATDVIINSEATTTLYTQMRHLGISTIFCIQNPNKIVSPLMKNNTTIFVISKLNDQIARSAIMDKVKSGLESIDSSLALSSKQQFDKIARYYYNEKIMGGKYRMFVYTISNEKNSFYII
jgi:hypothetical protein